MRVEFLFKAVPILFMFFFNTQGQITYQKNSEVLVFQGEVEIIGPSPKSVSGVIEVYQLVKYKVDRVVIGNFDGKEIIVDHLLLDGKELKQLKVGKKVCVQLRKSKEIGQEYVDEVLRKFSDEVNIFYIGNAYKRFKSSPCYEK
jgi:hypothetical protein